MELTRTEKQTTSNSFPCTIHVYALVHVHVHAHIHVRIGVCVRVRIRVCVDVRGRIFFSTSCVNFARLTSTDNFQRAFSTSATDNFEHLDFIIFGNI
jgi:hypothetical protein